jgi:hypothetical protein
MIDRKLLKAALPGAGRLQSNVPTGKLVSAAKYQFRFGYNKHHNYDLDPPLVLGSESILRFEVAIAPEGTFPSSGGMVSTKLIYRTGKGRLGVLPLIRFDAADYKDYPDIYRTIRRKGRLDFPVFKSSNPIRYERFFLTKTGAVQGKPLR